MPLHEARYQHWAGQHTSIWGRRRVIAQNGLAACLSSKPLRHVMVICWTGGLLMAGFLFALGQLLVKDSIVAQWVSQMKPEIQTFARLLTDWLQNHPEVSVGVTENVLFYFYCVYMMPLSVFALGMTLPSLITRDLASDAIVLYSSKAVTRGDYLLGKFSAAFGVLTLTWLGPFCAAWFMGNLLAPDWKFFWHARFALIHGLVFGLSSMVILSMLALGVSAVSQREKSTPFIWWAWWVLGIAIQPIAAHTLLWLRHASFGYDLRQIGLASFQLGRDLKTAQMSIPIFGSLLQNIPAATRSALDHPTLGGALAGLAFMLLGAGLIIRKRVAPE
jgi:ABC-2 type transport system permease protein